MRKSGVQATFHYQPLDGSDAGRALRGARDGVPGLARHQRPAAAAAVLEQPDRARPRPGDDDVRRGHDGDARQPVTQPVSGADAPVQPGSSSLRPQGYWWHRARADLLGVVMRPHLGTPRRTLDVGSADAPSVGWMRGEQQHVSLDLLPEGLVPGQGVCGSATELPFADETFDVVSAFDVVEHCADDARAIAELARVLTPGGRMLLSVPAYQWAWIGPRRPGRPPPALHADPRWSGWWRAAGWSVVRATYAFSGVFPLFVAERLKRRVAPPPPGDTRLPQVSDACRPGADGPVRRRRAGAAAPRPALRLVGAPGRGQARGTERSADDATRERDAWPRPRSTRKTVAVRGTTDTSPSATTATAPTRTATAPRHPDVERPVAGQGGHHQHHVGDRQRAARRDHRGDGRRRPRPCCRRPGAAATGPAARRTPRPPGPDDGEQRQAARQRAQVVDGDRTRGPRDPLGQLRQRAEHHHVGRAEEGERGEHRRDLDRRAAQERQQHRAAGQHGLGDELPGRGPAEERERARLAGARRRRTATPTATARPARRRPARARGPPGRARRRAGGRRRGRSAARSRRPGSRPPRRSGRGRRARRAPRRPRREPSVTSTTSTGNHASSRWKRRSRSSQATSAEGQRGGHHDRRDAACGAAYVALASGDDAAGDPVLEREREGGAGEGPLGPQHRDRGGRLGAEATGDEREEHVGQQPADDRSGGERGGSPARPGHPGSSSSRANGSLGS